MADCATLKGKTPVAISASADNQGATDFFELLHGLRQVPEVLLPGKRIGEDDSTGHGYRAGQQMIITALQRAGFKASDPARAAGFAAGMARYVLPRLGQLNDPTREAAAALACVDVAVSGGPVRIADAATTALPEFSSFGSDVVVERLEQIAGLAAVGMTVSDQNLETNIELSHDALQMLFETIRVLALQAKKSSDQQLDQNRQEQIAATGKQGVAA